jgi:hypothetical protein
VEALSFGEDLQSAIESPENGEIGVLVRAQRMLLSELRHTLGVFRPRPAGVRQ